MLKGHRSHPLKLCLPSPASVENLSLHAKCHCTTCRRVPWVESLSPLFILVQPCWWLLGRTRGTTVHRDSLCPLPLVWGLGFSSSEKGSRVFCMGQSWMMRTGTTFWVLSRTNTPSHSVCGWGSGLEFCKAGNSAWEVVARFKTALPQE